MGGNLFRDHNPQRIHNYEINRFVVKIQSAAIELWKSPNCIRTIPYYRDKKDHGDIDLLLDSELTGSADPSRDLCDLLGIPLEHRHSNGPVHSFLLDQVQIDLIHSPHHLIEMARDYFSYNDLGNLIGRLTHKLGIKTGHDGLSIVVRSAYQENHILGTIFLSREYNDVLDILGVSIDKFRAGFDSLEEIFQYVASSRYFDPNVFLLENRNHTSRIRDRKRKTYMEFLNYCRDRDLTGNFNFDSVQKVTYYNVREPFYTDVILSRYPWVADEMAKLVARDQEIKAFKTVYNGDIVAEITGLTGKSLGRIMAHLTFDDSERESMITSQRYREFMYEYLRLRAPDFQETA